MEGSHDYIYFHKYVSKLPEWEDINAHFEQHFIARLLFLPKEKKLNRRKRLKFTSIIPNKS
jgi:hypothetical protein